MDANRKHWRRYVRAILRAHGTDPRGLSEEAALDAFWVLQKGGEIPGFGAFLEGCCGVKPESAPASDEQILGA